MSSPRPKIRRSKSLLRAFWATPPPSLEPPPPGEGTLGPDGGLLYTPAANFNGVDGFSYLANDGSADSDAAAVTINVTPVNDAPASTADSSGTDEDTALVV